LLLKIKNKIKCTKFIFYWNQLLNKYWWFDNKKAVFKQKSCEDSKISFFE
jgi:hypothetical protein